MFCQRTFWDFALIIAAAWPNSVVAARPVVNAGGVVNAASYAQPGVSIEGLAPGSIAAVFGEDLSSTTSVATSLPLPIELSGVSVRMNGVQAPLFFVSPRQINFQIPFTLFDRGALPPGRQAILQVKTPSGESNPQTVKLTESGFGIFTLDGSGCGRPAVMNVNPEGSMSLNSPLNSAEPGGHVAVFGTGLGHVYGPLPDGHPGPESPLAKASSVPGILLNQQPQPDWPFGPIPVFSGRAPGLVGVDQINVYLPADGTTVQGCSVALQAVVPRSASQLVPISIHAGGGACVDPPPDTLATIRWEKDVVSSGIAEDPHTDRLLVEMIGGINKQRPRQTDPPHNCTCGDSPPWAPSCPGFEDKHLDAGVLTLTGSAFGRLEVLPRQQQDGPRYEIAIPAGLIQPGTFSVTAGGGPDLGPFQSNLVLPAPIAVTTRLRPGAVISYYDDFSVAWTGGDSGMIVSVRLISNAAELRRYCECSTEGSAGSVTLPTVPTYDVFGTNPRALPYIYPTDNAEVIIIVRPSLANEGEIDASGLTLGGTHSWLYRYYYGQLRIGDHASP